MKGKHTKWPELKGIDDKSPEYRHKLRSISPAYWLINCTSTAKQRAKLRGYEYNLDRDYLLDLMGYTYGDYWDPKREKCPVLGIPYNFVGRGKGGGHDSKSIDRINPRKGYVKGNVRFISRKANGMFLDGTPEEQLQVAVWKLKNDPITDKEKVKELLEDATNFIYSS
jgi:hypothetical protein